MREKIKVRQVQRNSRMCIICGLDNEIGTRAKFYSMEDGSCMTRLRFSKLHQSYPGRVHGGMITAALDELGLRALWAAYPDKARNEFGVTLTLTTKYRMPVPYEQEIYGRGEIIKNSQMFLVTKASLFDEEGNVYAEGEQKYIKLSPEKISEGVDEHEEMPYLIEDGVTKI